MDTEGLDEIAVGAEGSVYRTEFLGRRAILKVRSPKGYRAPELDARIRSLRIRSEARLIRDARRAGIRTPMIYWVDPAAGEMIMEDMGGETVKKHLDEEEENEGADIRSFKFHSFEKNYKGELRGEKNEERGARGERGFGRKDRNDKKDWKDQKDRNFRGPRRERESRDGRDSRGFDRGERRGGKFDKGGKRFGKGFDKKRRFDDED